MRGHVQRARSSFHNVLVLVVATSALEAPANEPAAAARHEPVSADLAREAADSLHLSKATLATLTPVRRSDNTVAVDVPLPSGPGRLVLRPHSVRSPDYRLTVQGADGTYAESDPGRETTYRGFVQGVAGSAVAASIEDGTIHALVLIPGQDRFWVESVPDGVGGAAAGLHVLYEDGAVPAGGQCGVADHPLDRHDPVQHGAAPPSAPVTSTAGSLPNDTWFAELGVDTDFDFFERFGSVEGTEARIHSIVNTVNIQYERDVGIQHFISHMIIRTAPTELYASRSANTLLFKFADHWFRFLGSVQRDTAHLFTGKSLSEGVLGLANFSGICSTTEGYGLTGYIKICNDGDNLGDLCGSDSDCPGGSCVDGVCQAFACRTDIAAHELGHNWAAPHCNCPGWTMHPSAQSANRFHPDFTIPRIVAYRDTVTVCLLQGDELIDLFVDPASPTLGGGNEIRLTAIADFLYGIDKDVSTLATWSVDRPEIATVDADGNLVASAVDNPEAVVVSASFAFDGVTKEASALVTIEPAPPAPIPDLQTPEKNRYISLVPPPVEGPFAIQVTLVTLQRPIPPNLPQFPPFDFSASEGDVLWVGPPMVCPDLPLPSRDYLCASLLCEPYYSEAWGDEVIHVTGAEIMPSSAYDIRVIPEVCRDTEAGCAFLSPPLRIGTQRWGDVAAPFQEPSAELLTANQPNIQDVTTVVDRVKQIPGSFLKPLVHLWSPSNGLVIDAEVSVLDITLVVDALQGYAYPFFGPCECPPSPSCPNLDRCGRCVQK